MWTQPPAWSQKSRVGSGAHSRGLWFHSGLRTGGAAQREKGSMNGSRKECRGKGKREGRAEGWLSEAGLIRRHCEDSRMSDFRIHMLFVIHMTDKHRCHPTNEQVCISRRGDYCTETQCLSPEGL